ncbi:MAG: hypothetical protein F6K22_11800 [Okeania sp. SIO2F4]|uniref:hypothetical protein n=1 Tax=Okeania sp. SIO2F4 TaxID=2607790 RepID=UPI00142C229E|nr:hypothetical protein [Okeania sp. SIO2F4]NES03467.1 hypothetical protein [Okeania sp. SIO2F4]
MMNNKRVVITQTSNPTENIQVKPDLPNGNSPVDILLAIAVLITAIAKLVEVSVPVVKKKNK